MPSLLPSAAVIACYLLTDGAVCLALSSCFRLPALRPSLPLSSLLCLQLVSIFLDAFFFHSLFPFGFLLFFLIFISFSHFPFSILVSQPHSLRLGFFLCFIPQLFLFFIMFPLTTLFFSSSFSLSLLDPSVYLTGCLSFSLFLHPTLPPSLSLSLSSPNSLFLPPFLHLPFPSALSKDGALNGLLNLGRLRFL